MTTESTANNNQSTLHKLWRRFVVRPIKQQFTQGITVEKVALAMALSPIIAAFPVLGTTNFIAILFGAIFRLNIPFLILFKTLFYPLHLGLILVFIRIGETINNAPHIPFSIMELLAKFKESPSQFAKDFGMTALYGIEAWAIITPLFGFILYFLFKYLLQRYVTVLPSTSIETKAKEVVQ